jgi:hypothetical protein
LVYRRYYHFGKPELAPIIYQNLGGVPRSGARMATRWVHLLGAIALILAGIVMLLLIGPIGLFLLVVAALLLWFDFGPGAHASGFRPTS